MAWRRCRTDEWGDPTGLADPKLCPRPRQGVQPSSFTLVQGMTLLPRELPDSLAPSGLSLLAEGF